MASSRQIRISITSALNAAGIEATKQQVAAMTKSVNNSLGGMAQKNRRHMADIKAGFDMLIGAARSVANVVASVLKKAFSFETALVNFKTLTGSMEAAKKHVMELRKFASATPLTFDDLSNASRTLLAFGVAVDDVMPALKTLGDISLGNSEKLKSLALVFGQVKSAGRLMGQDLLQMINQGFNPLTIISQETGESMADLKKAMEEGAISFEMVEAAMKKATSAGGLFHNAMENASKTGEGLISTLKDNWTQAVETFGLAFLDAAKNGVGTLSDNLRKLKEDGSIELWARKSSDWLEAFAEGAKVTLKPVVDLLGGAVKTIYRGWVSLGAGAGRFVGTLQGGGGFGEALSAGKQGFTDQAWEFAEADLEADFRRKMDEINKRYDVGNKSTKKGPSSAAPAGKSIAQMYAEQRTKVEKEAIDKTAKMEEAARAKKAAEEKKLAEAKRKDAENFVAGVEAAEKEAERDALKLKADNLKKLHREHMKNLDDQIRKANEEAAIWEQNAQRARGVNLNDWTRDERGRAREEQREQKRMDNQKKIAERELARLEANEKRGRAFTNDRDKARMKELREWLGAQDPNNNPALKQAQQLEQDKLKAAQDTEKHLNDILIKLNALGL